MIGFAAGAAVFTVLFFAAAYEPRTRPARPSFRPLCPCGCGRAPWEHNEPLMARALAVVPLQVACALAAALLAFALRRPL